MSNHWIATHSRGVLQTPRLSQADYFLRKTVIFVKMSWILAQMPYFLAGNGPCTLFEWLMRGYLQGITMSTVHNPEGTCQGLQEALSLLTICQAGQALARQCIFIL
jgi:hypothetical protein